MPARRPGTSLPRPPRRALLRAAAAAPALAALAPWARAQLRVEVTGVGADQVPIAVASFQRDGALPQELDAIIRADLARSGRLRLIDAGGTALHENARIVHPEWKGRGADALVVGSTLRLADGRYDVRFRLHDTVKAAQLDGLAYVATAAELRQTAHRIADRIVEKLTGERGVSATRIVYVAALGRDSFELQIADADGAGALTALRSRLPIMSPCWAPDGQRLAYVSFETGKPVVYVHTLASGQRRAVANFRGSNSAPAWSPDGRQLAVALTRDGGTQLFLVAADAGDAPQRLTRSSAIDTEPVFAPDGRQIYFTSDRGGGPQIYRMGTDGSAVQRVTFSGDYNVSPRLSPDGRVLAYVARRAGRFRVATLDLASAQETLVTDSGGDESPSFAPNGRLLLYATESAGRGVLATVSVDGRIRTRLTGPVGDIREPAWGPYLP